MSRKKLLLRVKTENFGFKKENLTVEKKGGISRTASKKTTNYL